MPRHAPFYVGLACGAGALILGLWLVPEYAISLGSNALFAVFLLLRGRIAVLQNDVLQNSMVQNSVPYAGAMPRADARKLSHPSPRRLPRHPASA